MTNFGDKAVYQVYPKSFMDSDCDGTGDLKGIIKKLDYIQDLGMDYLWLTPVFTSPLHDNGYDVADYCSIDPGFGSMEDMEELIAQAERRGIGIMLDMVFNHTSTQHEWFQKALAGEERYRNYYIFKEGESDRPPTNWQSKFGGPAWEYIPKLNKWYLHLFDVTQADLNWDNPAVREELKQVILFWKNKGVRAFRFDVVNLISKPEVYEDDLQGDGRRFYSDGPHIHEYLKELTRDTGISGMLTVGEMSSTSLQNCIRYSNPKEKEMSMCFNFHHLKVDYKNGDKWSLMEPDLMELKRFLEEWQAGMQEGGGWNALFWSNHDQPRIVSRLGDDQRYWKESAKMLAAAMYLMRGTPYIYQGEELGMTNARYDTISQYRDIESLNYCQILLERGKTQEEALTILAARSRDNGRTPMQWSDAPHAGFTKGTPWIEVNHNHTHIHAAAQINRADSIHTFYKKLIALRKTKKALSTGIIQFLERENPNVLAYKRLYKEEELIALHNLTGEKITVLMCPLEKTHQKILGNYENSTINKEGVILNPYETILLEKLN